MTALLFSRPTLRLLESMRTWFASNPREIDACFDQKRNLQVSFPSKLPNPEGAKLGDSAQTNSWLPPIKLAVNESFSKNQRKQTEDFILFIGPTRFGDLGRCKSVSERCVGSQLFSAVPLPARPRPSGEILFLKTGEALIRGRCTTAPRRLAKAQQHSSLVRYLCAAFASPGLKSLVSLGY